MRRLPVVLSSFFLLHSSFAHAADLNAIPPKDSPEMKWWRDANESRDTRLQWWREAKFGMFIHWGVYSPLGNVYNGRKGGGYSEHIQRVLKIPIPEYRENVAAKFNPEKFNADEWVKLARDAGMGYLVITAKHHDGFAMYPSAVSTYDLPDTAHFKRDPMRELKEACDKHGIKFGFYYSHAFDWGEANAPGNDWDHANPGGDKLLHGGRNWWDNEDGKQFLPKARQYVDSKSIPQIKELISNYHPAILWFDTPHKLPPAYNLDILKATRATGPDVVINGRLVRGYGDYDSTADRPAEFPPHNGDWEGIPTTNESYAWSTTDTSHKPPEHFIRLLAKAAARGGNLLMNIGPRGDGTIDPPDVRILRGIAKWMAINHPSISGTTKTPLAVQSWGESTRKGNTLFLHIFDYPNDGKLTVAGLKSTPTNARLLAAKPEQSLASSRISDTDLQITLPPDFTPDKTDTVLALTFGTDDIQTDPTTRLLSASSPNLLRAFDGQISGKLRFGPGKKTDDTLMNWSDPKDTLTFTVRAPKETTYTVTAHYDADPASAGGAFAVKTPTQSLTIEVRPGKSQQVSLGSITLTSAAMPLQVLPITIKGTELMRLRSLTLTPTYR